MVSAVEGVGDGGVNVDEHVVLRGDLLVPGHHLAVDELGEGITAAGVDDVHQPLLWKMLDVFLVGDCPCGDCP